MELGKVKDQGQKNKQKKNDLQNMNDTSFGNTIRDGSYCYCGYGKRWTRSISHKNWRI